MRQCPKCLTTFPDPEPQIGILDGQLIGVWDPDDFRCPTCGYLVMK